MKQVNIIEKFNCPDNCNKKDCEICFEAKHTTEKVPETFEDVKELCKNLKDVVFEEKDEMDVACLILFSFNIRYFEDNLLMVDGFYKKYVSPVQAWNIIKSLTMEE